MKVLGEKIATSYYIFLLVTTVGKKEKGEVEIIKILFKSDEFPIHKEVHCREVDELLIDYISNLHRFLGSLIAGSLTIIFYYLILAILNVFAENLCCGWGRMQSWASGAFYCLFHMGSLITQLLAIGNTTVWGGQPRGPLDPPVVVTKFQNSSQMFK